MKMTVKCRQVLGQSVPVSPGVEQIMSAAKFDTGNRAQKNAQGQDVAITPELTIEWNSLQGKPFTEGLDYEIEIKEAQK